MRGAKAPSALLPAQETVLAGGREVRARLSKARGVSDLGNRLGTRPSEAVLSRAHSVPPFKDSPLWGRVLPSPHSQHRRETPACSCPLCWRFSAVFPVFSRSVPLLSRPGSGSLRGDRVHALGSIFPCLPPQEQTSLSAI